MSASSLMSRGAMNGCVDDQTGGGYHCHYRDHHQPLRRDFANLSIMNFENQSQSSMKTHSNQNFLFEPEHNLHSSNVLLQENNLYGGGSGSSCGSRTIVNGDLDPVPSCSLNTLIEPAFDAEDFHGAGMRKSANMTETVAVPSSEHVAEIVGRQGCKIKSLRTQTNTYIKTPVRGAEPVFVVTGRREDVAKARDQILSAAEHFSSIRASRRNGSGGTQVSANSGTSSPTSVPGHITAQVRVPYKVVGLVVGPKGATIKRIQQMSSTYIVTPGRDKEPIFEVTGLPDSVEKAKDEIEKHIASRTGSDNNSDLQIDDFQVNGIEAGYDQNGDSLNGGVSKTASYHYGNSNNVVNHHDNLPPLSTLGHTATAPPPASYQQMASSSRMLMNPSSVASSLKISDFNMLPQQFNRLNQSGAYKSGNDFDVDEGFVTSGSNASAASVYDPSAAVWNDVSSFGIQRSNSISVSARILPPGEDGPHPRTRRTNSDPLANAFQKVDTAFSCPSPNASQDTSPATSSHTLTLATPRNCMVCQVKGVEAGFTTCGHSEFCMNCAQEICQREQTRRKCPICKFVPNGVVRLQN